MLKRGLVLLCLLTAACGSAPAARVAARATPRPSPSSTPSPVALPSPSPPPPPPAPSPSPTPTEMQRLAAATRPQLAPSSAALDARMAGAYAVFRDPHQPPATRVAAARTIQLLTSQLVTTPAWRPAALAALKPTDRTSLQAGLDAGDEIGALNDNVDGTPQWRIAAPDPLPNLVSDYQAGEQSYGIPWRFLAAINFIETAMGRVHGLSVAGAEGPMQFMPATWAIYGSGDVHNPHDAVLAAARYLHAKGGPGNMDAAIYAYNPSHHYVNAVEIYAQQVATDPDALALYYDWQVIVPTSEGPAVIPEGWSSG